MAEKGELEVLAELLKLLVPVVSVVLGGILGAGLSYLVSRKNFARETQRRDLEEYRRLLREIAIDFSEFEDSAHKLIAFHVDRKNNAKGNPFTFDEVHADYVRARAKYRAAGATLRILGLPEVAAVLAECNEYSNRVFLKYESLHRSELNGCLLEFKTQAKNFYDALSVHASFATS